MDYQALFEQELSKIPKESWESLSSGKEKAGKYRASKKWALLKKILKQKQNGLCAMCGKHGDNLHMHHNNYARYYNELIEDVELVHPECHSDHHYQSEDFMKDLQSPVSVDFLSQEDSVNLLYAFIKERNTENEFDCTLSDIYAFVLTKRPTLKQADEKTVKSAISSVISRLGGVALVTKLASLGGYKIESELVKISKDNLKLIFNTVSNAAHSDALPHLQRVSQGRIRLSDRIQHPEVKSVIERIGLSYKSLFERRQSMSVRKYGGPKSKTPTPTPAIKPKPLAGNNPSSLDIIAVLAAQKRTIEESAKLAVQQKLLSELTDGQYESKYREKYEAELRKQYGL